MKYYIYSLQDAKGQPPFYIGCTYDPQKRYPIHKRKYLKLRGVEPIIRIIKTTNDFDVACKIEQENISYYNKLTKNRLLNKGKKQGKRPDGDPKQRFIISQISDWDEYNMLWYTKIGLNKPGLPIICVVAGKTEVDSFKVAEKMKKILELCW